MIYSASSLHSHLRVNSNRFDSFSFYYYYDYCYFFLISSQEVQRKSPLSGGSTRPFLQFWPSPVEPVDVTAWTAEDPSVATKKLQDNRCMTAWVEWKECRPAGLWRMDAFVAGPVCPLARCAIWGWLHSLPTWPLLDVKREVFPLSLMHHLLKMGFILVGARPRVCASSACACSLSLSGRWVWLQKCYATVSKGEKKLETD